MPENMNTGKEEPLHKGLEPVNEDIAPATNSLDPHVSWVPEYAPLLLDEGNLLMGGEQELPPNPTVEQLTLRRDYLLGWLERDRNEYQTRFPVIQDIEEGIKGAHKSREEVETDPLLDEEIRRLVHELFDIGIRLGDIDPPKD